MNSDVKSLKGLKPKVNYCGQYFGRYQVFVGESEPMYCLATATSREQADLVAREWVKEKRKYSNYIPAVTEIRFHPDDCEAE